MGVEGSLGFSPAEQGPVSRKLLSGGWAGAPLGSPCSGFRAFGSAAEGPARVPSVPPEAGGQRARVTLRGSPAGRQITGSGLFEADKHLEVNPGACGPCILPAWAEGRRLDYVYNRLLEVSEAPSLGLWGCNLGSEMQALGRCFAPGLMSVSRYRQSRRNDPGDLRGLALESLLETQACFAEGTLRAEDVYRLHKQDTLLCSLLPAPCTEPTEGATRVLPWGAAPQDILGCPKSLRLRGQRLDSGAAAPG